MSDSYLKSSDLEVVKMFLTEELRSTARRGIPMADIFDNVKEMLGLDDDDKIDFCKALSASINSDKIPELEIKKGPGGGVGFKGKNPTTTKLPEKRVAPPPIKPVAVEVEKVAGGAAPLAAGGAAPLAADVTYCPPAVAAPLASFNIVPTQPKVQKIVPKEKYDLWIGNEVYTIPYSKSHIETLLKNVFEAKEDNDGKISFEGTKYYIDEVASNYLEKFLFFFDSASLKR